MEPQTPTLKLQVVCNAAPWLMQPFWIDVASLPLLMAPSSIPQHLIDVVGPNIERIAIDEPTREERSNRGVHKYVLCFFHRAA